MSDIGNRIWSFCHVLRKDGVDYNDFIEQITFLIFLKMADERGIDLSNLPVDEITAARTVETRTVNASWSFLASLSGLDLVQAYDSALRALSAQPGVVGMMFTSARSLVLDPAKLKQLFGTVGGVEWTALGVDVKGAIYEELLERAASEGKKGAGQYFTPRLLIQSIVRCSKPDPRTHDAFVIGDPACGTGGFLLEAYEWFLDQTRGGALDVDLAKRVRRETYYGQEFVARTRRLAMMNLFLHNLEPNVHLGDSLYQSHDGRFFDVVLANPPFGNKGAKAVPERDEFPVETANTQLNFLQHILHTLKPGGRAAVVVPDNVLFERKAGELFRILTRLANLHTVVRLPRGTFNPYTNTKTYVLFFQKGRPTEKTWLYDARAGVPPITKKDRPLTAEHFAAFERCYGDDPNGLSARSEADDPEGRWRAFTMAEVEVADFKLDGFKWLKDSDDDDGDLPEPDELAAEAIARLEAALDDLAAIRALLDRSAEVSA